jgi:glyoxylase-like metal-dependent hydrolase (beta-lactamase superfamily II)
MASESPAPEPAAFDRVSRLEFETEWPPGHAAAWLIDGAEPILVDAGVPDEGGERTLREGLAARGHTVGDVGHVVVTHPHSDHVGQVPTLMEAGAEVYAPADALEQIRRDPDDLAASVRETAREAGLDPERADFHVEKAVASLERDRRLLPPEDVDVAVPFDDPFAVGAHEFTAIHTPGHQKHHASFTVELDGRPVLFSGDALIEPFRAAAIHAGMDRGAYEAIDAFYAAMDRFAALDAEHAFPGHGPDFADVSGAIASTRGSLDRLVEATADALRAVEPATPLAVSHERFGEAEHPAPLLDTVGAIGTLETQGRAAYTVEDGVRQYEYTG